MINIKKFITVMTIMCTVTAFSACNTAQNETKAPTQAPTAEASATATPQATLLPARELNKLYSGYRIIVDDNERQYVKKAAAQLEQLLSPQLEPSDGEGVLTVYVGKMGLPKDESVDINGYVIKQKDGNIMLYGSNAENTYIAVSRYINQILKQDAINISTFSRLEMVVPQASRQEYIADVSKLETVWQYQWAPPEWMLDFGEKVLTVLDASARPICYAHRGDIEHYPENSIEGIISAVKKGADLVEVDVYLTKDGVPVLNHGEDLSVTTDWSLKRGQTVDGLTLPRQKEINKWTYEQLCKLNLRTGNGEYTDANSEITDYKIPTLTEVFTVCKDRAFILIDKMGAEHWDMVLDIIKQTGNGRSFIYTDMAKSRAEAESMQQQVQAALGVSAPHMWTRGMRWSGTWFDEFELTTTEQFEQYYAQQIQKGEYVSTNRVSRLVDYIAKYYKSTRDKYN